MLALSCPSTPHQRRFVRRTPSRNTKRDAHARTAGRLAPPRGGGGDTGDQTVGGLPVRLGPWAAAKEPASRARDARKPAAANSAAHAEQGPFGLRCLCGTCSANLPPYPPLQAAARPTRTPQAYILRSSTLLPLALTDPPPNEREASPPPAPPSSPPTPARSRNAADPPSLLHTRRRLAPPPRGGEAEACSCRPSPHARSTRAPPRRRRPP